MLLLVLLPLQREVLNLLDVSEGFKLSLEFLDIYFEPFHDDFVQLLILLVTLHSGAEL